MVLGAILLFGLLFGWDLMRCTARVFACEFSCACGFLRFVSFCIFFLGVVRCVVVRGGYATPVPVPHQMCCGKLQSLRRGLCDLTGSKIGWSASTRVVFVLGLVII